MKELFHGRGGAEHLELEERIRAIHEFSELVRGAVAGSIVASVDESAWREAVAPVIGRHSRLGRELGSGYQAVYLVAMRGLGRMVDHLRSSKCLAFMAKQKKEERRASSLWGDFREEHGVPYPAFREPMDFAPLQAADMLAWSERRAWTHG